jgi:hypothetical protein
LKTGGKIKKAQGGEFLTQEDGKYTSTKKVKTKNGPRYYQGKSPSMSFARELAFDKTLNVNDSIPKSKLSARALEVMDQKNGGKVKKAQLGTLVKKGAKAVGLGTAAAAGASSASSCSSGRCFHKRGGWTSGGRSPWRKNGGTVKKAQNGVVTKRLGKNGEDTLEMTSSYAKELEYSKKKNELSNKFKKAKKDFDDKSKKKAKTGAMIKRADGSTSQRGLWDNIRANKGSGKKPTAAMLKQEKKIKAKAQTGGSFGNVYTGPAKTNPGVLKAKADKAKANANLAAYKLKSKK